MHKKFYKRKIQRFSKYSYAVTLPVDWVKKKDLERTRQDEKSDPDNQDPVVNIFEMADGSLQIYPESEVQSRKPQMYRLDLDMILKENPKFIEEKGISLMLISYYMNGAAGVEIISKDPISSDFVDQIEKIQSRLLFNWNLIRESSRRLIIKNIFTETPENIFQEIIPQYLRESFSVLLWMLDDIHDAILKKDYSELENIIEQDTRIDRYYFFVVRQIRTIFENPRITRPIKYSHKKLIDLRLLAKLIEEVGDSLKDIARILIDYHSFIDELNLEQYLDEYFNNLREGYAQLADFLRRSVSEHQPPIGLNPQVMNMIQKYRKIGQKLNEKWLKIAPELYLKPNDYSFLEYFRGSRLIRDLEDVFRNIFDFTNVFF